MSTTPDLLAMYEILMFEAIYQTTTKTPLIIGGLNNNFSNVHNHDGVDWFGLNNYQTCLPETCKLPMDAEVILGPMSVN